MLGIIYSGFVMLASYRIIRIEDDPTPLAAGTHSTGIYSRGNIRDGIGGSSEDRSQSWNIRKQKEL